MNAARTKQSRPDCAHSKGEPGVPAYTTNISVRFAPDSIIHFPIEKTMEDLTQGRPAGWSPRSTNVARSLAAWASGPGFDRL